MMVDDAKRGEVARRQRILEAQRLVRRYVPEGVSLSDELVAERRACARGPEQNEGTGAT